MNLDDRNELIEEFFQKVCMPILDAKGADYAGRKTDDPNQNFSIIAELMGLSKYQVWAVYYLKQVIAILNAIKVNPEKPVTSAESIDQRIADAVNYPLIMKSMLIQDEGIYIVSDKD